MTFTSIQHRKTTLLKIQSVLLPCNKNKAEIILAYLAFEWQKFKVRFRRIWRCAFLLLPQTSRELRQTNDISLQLRPRCSRHITVVCT